MTASLRAFERSGLVLTLQTAGPNPAKLFEWPKNPFRICCCFVLEIMERSILPCDEEIGAFRGTVKRTTSASGPRPEPFGTKLANASL